MVKCDAPISKRLLWGLEKHIIPLMLRMHVGFQDVKFECETISLKQVNGLCVTGLSCGVDSLTTIFNNLKDDQYGMGLDAFVLFNLHRLYHEAGEAEKIYFSAIEHKRDIAKQIGLPLIWTDSNLWEFLNSFRYIQVHSFYAISHCMLLQGYVSRYLYSAAYDLKHFEPNFSDTAFYDLYLSAFLKTETFEFLTDGELLSRTEKTRLISSKELSYSLLDVCNNKELASKKGMQNCGVCDKCVRTQLTLDVLGKLDQFSDVFDINQFNMNKNKIWTEYMYIYMRTKNIMMQEVIDLAKKEGYLLPPFITVRCILFFLKLQIRKLIVR